MNGSYTFKNFDISGPILAQEYMSVSIRKNEVIVGWMAEYDGIAIPYTDHRGTLEVQNDKSMVFRLTHEKYMEEDQRYGYDERLEKNGYDLVGSMMLLEKRLSLIEKMLGRKSWNKLEEPKIIDCVFYDDDEHALCILNRRLPFAGSVFRSFILPSVDTPYLPSVDTPYLPSVDTLQT